MTAIRSGTAVRDLRAIGLIGLAHGCSHFLQLVLPSLFPFLIADFDVSYTELGLMMTAFFVASGLAQPPAGFLVDRIGARSVLISGLALYGTAFLLVALSPSFWLFLPAVVLAGLGNSVFHPADYTILTASVSPSRLGRAYGVHTFGGNLGWAAAPALMLAVGSLWGWRAALMLAGAIALAIVVLLLIFRDDLREERTGGTSATSSGGTSMGLRPLLSAPVLLCFWYFVLLAAALIAVQNFLPATLQALHQTPLTVAGAALTGFLLGASAGVVLGGVMADRSSQHGVIIGGGLALAALLFLLVSLTDLPAVPLVAAVAGAGFLSGVTTPSRDMLVRSATPKGATGRVFGFVYSGLDAGSALAPALIGVMLDHGHPRWVLWLTAGVLLAAILTAVSIRTGATAAGEATSAPAT